MGNEVDTLRIEHEGGLEPTEPLPDGTLYPPVVPIKNPVIDIVAYELDGKLTRGRKSHQDDDQRIDDTHAKKSSPAAAFCHHSPCTITEAMHLWN